MGAKTDQIFGRGKQRWGTITGKKKTKNNSFGTDRDLRRALVRKSRARMASWIGVALLLSVSAGACGSSGSSTTSVVPATGKVAGEGYGYWLQRWWQTAFSTSGPRNPCETLTANGQTIGFLTPATPGTTTASYTCSEPTGRPLYVAEPMSECSTFSNVEGSDHGTFGTSDQQLMQCARARFKNSGIQLSATVDGHAVDVGKLLAATGVYPVQAVGGNLLGFPSGSGRSAVYGHGLLLTGLAKGTHVIHSVGSAETQAFDMTFTVHVQ
ncbi:MAG TPA: hypothetical protein VEF89_12650 [Solirubrobacteraceae bacterium]|nr:hypothetical protein [Solirubrobacteraceae bacterium]